MNMVPATPPLQRIAVKPFTRAMALLAVTFILVGVNACRMKISWEKPPFTVDSLMTYTRADLLAFMDESDLKDSVSTDTTGTRKWYTLMLPGTSVEALICWTDSTHTQMWEVTVRVKPGQANGWMTRDSIRLGLSLTEVQHINGNAFWIGPEGSASSWSTLGYGRLGQSIASVYFDVSGPESVLSTDKRLLEHPPTVQSFSVTRWVLPNPITVIKHRIKDPKRGLITYIPQVINRYNSPFIRVELINKAILEQFDLPAYDSIVPNFGWSDISYSWEANNGYFALDYSASYLGSYPSDIHETLYINLAYGTTTTTMRNVPFIAFLKYDQFFPFFKKYWLTECLAKRAKADACAGITATCDCYKDISLSAAGTTINLSLDSKECLPHAAMACAPQHTLSLSFEELSPYLNDYGKAHVQTYAAPGLVNKIDTYLAYVSGELPPMLFLKSENVRMAGADVLEKLPDTYYGIQFNNDGTLTGYNDEGEPTGPVRGGGTYDREGFEITLPNPGDDPYTEEFVWGQTGEEIDSKSFHVDYEKPAAVVRSTNDEWFADIIQRPAMADEESPGRTTGAYPEIELSNTPKVVVCAYEGTDEGDCYHINFSCGDFVAANTELSEAEQELWNNLDQYIGRTFEITYSKTEGWPCQAGYPDTSQMYRGDVPLITGFKLLPN